MKKRKILLGVITGLCILSAGLFTVYKLCLPQPLNYDINSLESIGSSVNVISRQQDNVTIINTEDRDFKVLTFTDIHLDGKNETSSVTVTKLVENIKKEKPDLVVFGGDTITSILNRKRTKQFAEIFEKLGVYWCGVLGNHEGCNSLSVSRSDMVDIFSSYDHCLMRKGLEEVWGNGNYTVDILNKDGSLSQTLVFMDTGSEVNDEQIKQHNLDSSKTNYDGVKENQIKWYEQKIAETKSKYGEFSSVLFVHIPLPQYKTEAEKGKFVYGEKLENVCASSFDSGLFDALKQAKSTKAVFCGHDHVNTFGVELDGILLGYMEPSGYGSYTVASKFDYEEKDWLQGYMLLNIKSNGEFTYEHIRNSQNS